MQPIYTHVSIKKSKKFNSLKKIKNIVLKKYIPANLNYRKN